MGKSIFKLLNKINIFKYKGIYRLLFINSLKNIKSVYKESINRNGKREVKKANGWFLDDGTFLPLEKGKVFFKESEIKKNTELSNWLSEITGRPLEIQPIVVEPKYIKTSDAKWTDNNVKIEYKEFDIRTKDYDVNRNYISKKLGTGFGQANEFLIDITNSPISVYKAIKDLDEAIGYSSKQFVQKVYLKDGNKLIDVFSRR